MDNEKVGCQYYWKGDHNLGSGKNAIKKGDPLPESYACDPKTGEPDPRLEAWIDSGMVTDEEFVSFEADKQAELVFAQMRVAELEGANDELKGQIKELAKLKQPSQSASKQLTNVGKDLKASKKQVDKLTGEFEKLKESEKKTADEKAWLVEMISIMESEGNDNNKQLSEIVDILEAEKTYLIEMVKAIEIEKLELIELVKNAPKEPAYEKQPKKQDGKK